jgi:hypothetical protein
MATGRPIILNDTGRPSPAPFTRPYNVAKTSPNRRIEPKTFSCSSPGH